VHEDIAFRRERERRRAAALRQAGSTGPEDVEHSEPHTDNDLGDFDPDAYSAELDAWRRRRVYPSQPGGLIGRVLQGGHVGELALEEMRQKWKRSGWHYRSGVDGIQHWYRHFD
jgi:hypothetical protein